jgi:hypothetical protein
VAVSKFEQLINLVKFYLPFRDELFRHPDQSSKTYGADNLLALPFQVCHGFQEKLSVRGHLRPPHHFSDFTSNIVTANLGALPRHKMSILRKSASEAARDLREFSPTYRAARSGSLPSLAHPDKPAQHIDLDHTGTGPRIHCIAVPV